MIRAFDRANSQLAHFAEGAQRIHGSDPGQVTAVVGVLSGNNLLWLGLQHLVENERWIHLAGHAANITALDEMLTCESLHILIVDSEITHDLPALFHKIRTVNSRIRIILLSGLLEECARQIISCEIDGLVLKIQPLVVLIATIHHVICPAEEGHPQFGNGVAQFNRPKPSITFVRQTGQTPETKWPDGLTERECEVIRYIGQGLSNKDIADRLCISSITVRHHLTHIFDKLGVSNRQKLLIQMHQRGIAELTVKA